MITSTSLPVGLLFVDPGMLPPETVIPWLGGLLAVSAGLALLLLRALVGQRQRAGEAERLLDQQRTRAEGVSRELDRLTGHMPLVLFTLVRGTSPGLRLGFLAGDTLALFGLTPQALLESADPLRLPAWRERIDSRDLRRLRGLLVSSADSQGPHAIDLRAYGENGSRWIRLGLTPRSRDSTGLRWSGYAIDTTHIQDHNAALLAARDAAERASKAKSDFLATISHEIRTPMNGVLGMLELLAHTGLDDSQRELLGSIEDSAGVLLQVLNDVLDFSKLESGDLRLDEQAFDPRLWLDQACGMLAGPIKAKGLAFGLSVDPAVAGELRGDALRLRQILWNLLNNASKFTERGRIAVDLRVLGDDGQRQRLRLRVSDSGIGISAADQAKLFAPFQQAEQSTSRRYGGSGLGLAICRQLAKLMGGTISLQSEPGMGTTVTLELRLPVLRRHPALADELRGRHAIVRSGDTQGATALAEQLKALGFSVELIDRAEPLRAGISANLLFIDEDDRQSADQVAAIIIRLGGHDALRGSGSPPQGLALNLHPLRWTSLTRVCGEALPGQRHRTEGVAADGAGQPRASAARILVAEDHPLSRQLIHRQLDLLGWSCDLVGDGQAALDALSQGGYDLLLTDGQMPRLDGYELARTWRAREAAHGNRAHLPIIAMTANALDGERARCLAAGMDDYLSKPLRLDALEQGLTPWLGAPARRPAPGHAPVPAKRPATDPAGIHLSHDMLNLLRQTSAADFTALEQAITQANRGSIERHLHHLLGGMQWLGDDPCLREGRAWLDRLAHADTPLDQLPGYLERLRHWLNERAGELAH